MRNRNRWLAAVLTLSLALGNCGGITALATENIVDSENSLSENTIISDEAPEDDVEETENSGDFSETSAGHTDSEDQDTQPDADAISETEKAAPKTELPAIHIGQIPEDGTLPAADDDTFSYDLPVSFASAEALILFVNYDIEKTPTYKEAGTLEWSILRSESGAEPGSPNLLGAEDNWKDFETVLSSPYFTMEEITDTESEYYQMMTLVPEALFSAVTDNHSGTSEEAAEDYDYYIRAAYYPETEGVKAETFYNLPLLRPTKRQSLVFPVSLPSL